MVEASILKYLRAINPKGYKLTFFLLIICSLVFSQRKDIETLKTQRAQYQTDIENAKKLLIKKGNSRKGHL